MLCVSYDKDEDYEFSHHLMAGIEFSRSNTRDV